MLFTRNLYSGGDFYIERAIEREREILIREREPIIKFYIRGVSSFEQD